MAEIRPSSAEDLAGILRESASRSKTVAVHGNNSKRLMGGPISDSDVTISTSALNRLLLYEPRDLTISVEAGMRFAELQGMLKRQGQIIALDPPFSSQSTIGGVIASNSSGPMRCRFGTARDLVIGMNFATIDGKIVKTGGMVVKNVAGLDIGKVMIGSFGTLAVITSVNLRIHSMPRDMQTFAFAFPDLETALEKRNSILRGVLEPTALDLLSPPAAARLDRRGFVLAVRASGSPATLARYSREFSGSERLKDSEDASFWDRIREFPAEFLARQPEGIVLRISTTLDDFHSLLRAISSPAVSRAASGVTYVFITSSQSLPLIWKKAAEQGWSLVVEFAPEDIRTSKELWPLPHSSPGLGGFDMMKRVKQMFDPHNLLNRSRLYGRV